MVEYYKDNDTKLAQELRWMGIVLRRVKSFSHSDQREVQEKLNMWDDLMEKDPKMRKIRAQSRAEGKAEGLRMAVVTAVKVRFPHLVELAQQKVESISKPDALDLLLAQVTAAPDEATARLLFSLIAAA